MGSSLKPIKSSKNISSQHMEIINFQEDAGDIKYDISSDWEMIRRYFQLRANVYNEEGNNKVKGLLGQGKLDDYDMYSKYITARIGDICVGGARLVLKDNNSKHDLPLEGGCFSLEELLPELDWKNAICGESGRTVMHKAFRSGEHPKQLFRLTLDLCHEVGCRYLFGVAPLSQAKLYRRAYKAAGLDAVIRDDVVLPQKATDEDRRMYLVMADLWQNNLSTVH